MTTIPWVNLNPEKLDCKVMDLVGDASMSITKPEI
jgi:hypothetical protein